MKRYEALLAGIARTHFDRDKRGEFYCHDLDHVIRVALMALQIAEDKETGRLAALAGLCHNADRILQKASNVGGYGHVDPERIELMVRSWLSPVTDISEHERLIIVVAVLYHGERNHLTDSDVLVTLKDADRVVNTELDVVMRHAQYHPELPRLHPNHLLDIPGDGYRTPKSVLGNLLITRRELMEENGVASIRLPKARKLMKSRMAKLEQYAKDVLAQREEAGLVPYPTPYPEFV